MLPFAQEGVVPNLKKLMDTGCWGSLMSTVPPITCPAWPTFMTGKLPGKLGVYGFNDFGRYPTRTLPINSTYIKSRMFWEDAGEGGRRVFVMNFPITYPVRKANGGVISGFFTPKSAKDFFYPESLAPELTGYPFTFFHERPDNSGGLETYCAKMEDDIARLSAIALSMARKERWDLFMLCFQEPDHVNHFLWKYLDPDFPDYATADGEKVRASVKKMFSMMDDAAGKVIEILGPDAVIAGSDHGGRPAAEWSFNLNRLLMDEGLLKTNHGGAVRRIHKASPKFVKRWMEKKYLDKIELVDFSETRAWCFSYRCGSAGVFINLTGRFPGGKVSPGPEYEALVERIMKLLDGVRHDGVKVIDKTWRKEEVYSGPEVLYAPDIIFTTARNYEVPETNKFRDDVKAERLFEKEKKRSRLSGNHEPEGIYIINGKGVKSTGRSEDTGIENIAPTVLQLMGLPLPEDMDGKVMAHALEDFNPEDVRRERSAGYEAAVSETGDEDSRLIEEQLKGLGYM